METLQSMKTIETPNDGLKTLKELKKPTHVLKTKKLFNLPQDPIRPGSYKTL